MADVNQELLALNQQLLDSIADGNWDVYKELCDPTLTAVEPEAKTLLVHGMEFHRFYFELGGVRGQHQTTMVAPHVRVMDDVAIVTYTRLIQHVGETGQADTSASAETRIWQRQEGRWRHVHFHRTALNKEG